MDMDMDIDIDMDNIMDTVVGHGHGHRKYVEVELKRKWIFRFSRKEKISQNFAKVCGNSRKFDSRKFSFSQKY
jgi:hypothetical protein